jgi:hypothetical protein
VYHPAKVGNYWPSTSEDLRHEGRNGLAQFSHDDLPYNQ